MSSRHRIEGRAVVVEVHVEIQHITTILRDVRPQRNSTRRASWCPLKLVTQQIRRSCGPPDEIRRALGDGEDRDPRMAGELVRKDGSIDNAQALDAVYAQFEVDGARLGVGTHPR